jgi:hypothetical protein
MASLINIIIVILVILATTFIIVDVTRTYNKCPPPTTKYHFIPRTFREEQENPVPLDDIFFDMFNNSTPWIGIVDMEDRKSELLKATNAQLGRLDLRGLEENNINKHYVSQA